jgi:ATP-dependent RNA helicase DDX3X
MFSATFPQPIQALASEFLLEEHEFLSIGRVGSTSASITQTVLQVDSMHKFKKLVELLGEAKHNDTKVLVFVATKIGVDRLADKLEDEGFDDVLHIHGDRS